MVHKAGEEVINHCGHRHRRLADGSVLRLDVEMGGYTASWYSPPSMSLHMYAHGGFDEMKALYDAWLFAFEASILGGVGGRSGVASTPTPDHQTARETA